MAHGRMTADLRPQTSAPPGARVPRTSLRTTGFARQARELFATLRWAEEQAEAGALCVLLPELGGGGEAGRPVSKMAHALR